MRFQYAAIVMAVITPSATDAFVAVVNTHNKRYSSKNNHQYGYNINSNNSHKKNIVSLKASLRDLLGTPDDNNDSDPSSSKNVDTSNADNFNNMLQPQRRNFQGLPSPSEEDGNDDDDDELGLNMDRLRAFSFAGQIAPENTRVKKRSQQQQEEEREGQQMKKRGTASNSSKIGGNDTDDDDDDMTVRANDFHQMINVSYSKKQSTTSSTMSSSTSNNSRYPITQQISSSNIDQETGMHIDKISTFSFSSSNTLNKYDNGRTKVVSGSNGSNSLREDSWVNRSEKVGGGIGGDGLLSGGSSGSGSSGSGSSGSNVGGGGGSIGGESREERQKRMKEEVIASAAAATSTATTAAASATEESNVDNENIKEEDDDDATATAAVDIPMKVDNFHNMVNVDMSKNTGLKRLISSSSTPDGEVNHADRMATFSLLSTEKDDDDDNVGTPPPDLLSDNHGDRLGTFSFASGGGGGGGKNTKKTVKSAPIVKDKSEHSKAATAATPATTADNDGIVTNESYSQVYTPPQKGSLSSLASSLATKTRVDRIQEIKTLTDPRLLHPDGMNVPRLNAKGDVMSMSSTTGRKNIFERIDSANLQDDSDGGDDDGGKNEVVGGTEGDDEEEKDIANENDGEKDGDDEKKDAVDKAGAKDSNNDDNPTNNIVDSEDLDENLESGDCFIGFDLGTSGARMSIVEKNASNGQFEEVVTEALTWDNTLQYDNANDWRRAIDTLLSRAKGKEVMDRVKAICVSGTSATCLLVKRHSLEVSRKARMYNFDVKADQSSTTAVDNVMKLIDKYVPEKHTARATTGTLAKLLLWSEEQSLEDEVLCHQSDYVSLSLMCEGLNNDDDITTHCDFHNILKLGYDVRGLEYPSWMLELLEDGANIPNPQNVLPSKVISPGEPIGVISPAVAAKYGLSTNVVLVGGTTDSNAAFFAAAGANPEYGTAVTSLGSTLAIKQLSSTYVEDASRGVYSHRFPRFRGSSNDDDTDGGEDDGEEEEAWLIGGASNVGCAVLRAEGFTNEELSSLSLEIDPNTDSPLSYYPLIKTGERFPMADSTKEPILSPKPDSRKEYLHGILQGIGDVERDGFKVLGDLGATPKLPKVVLSCGGGSKNDMWIAMRKRRLKEIYGEGDDSEDDVDVVVKRATNTEASYGAALLAAATFGS